MFFSRLALWFFSVEWKKKSFVCAVWRSCSVCCTVFVAFHAEKTALYYHYHDHHHSLYTFSAAYFFSSLHYISILLKPLRDFLLDAIFHIVMILCWPAWLGWLCGNVDDAIVQIFISFKLTIGFLWTGTWYQSI